MNDSGLAKKVYDPKNVWMRGMRLEIVSNIVKFYGCRDGSYYMIGKNLFSLVKSGLFDLTCTFVRERYW